MYTSIVSFFQDGGTFMYPILIVLAIGLAIAIERYIYLTAAKTSNRQLLAKAMPLLKQGNFEQLLELTSQKKERHQPDA